MFQFIVVTSALLYIIVLTSFVISYVLTNRRLWRLLLRALRWSTTIWLCVSSVLASEVLRKGLEIHGGDFLPIDTLFGWNVWFIIVVVSIVAVAVAVVAYAMSRPEVLTLLDSGLVALRWLDLVYGPVEWAMLKILKWCMVFTFSWASWAINENWEKLQQSFNQTSPPSPYLNVVRLATSVL
ncbi:hypothetical protein GGR55DRAFT_642420 [Xylaria sp. FL0064]|nr:hypothetical protein GGR55DRAFT_642420 [Xylaria sp. FL0064]